MNKNEFYALCDLLERYIKQPGIVDITWRGQHKAIKGFIDIYKLDEKLAVSSISVVVYKVKTDLKPFKELHKQFMAELKKIML